MPPPPPPPPPPSAGGAGGRGAAALPKPDAAKSQLLCDITKGTRLKSTKNLMNDRSAPIIERSTSTSSSSSSGANNNVNSSRRPSAPAVLINAGRPLSVAAKAQPPPTMSKTSTPSGTLPKSPQPPPPTSNSGGWRGPRAVNPPAPPPPSAPATGGTRFGGTRMPTPPSPTTGPVSPRAPVAPPSAPATNGGFPRPVAGGNLRASTSAPPPPSPRQNGPMGGGFAPGSSSGMPAPNGVKGARPAISNNIALNRLNMQNSSVADTGNGAGRTFDNKSGAGAPPPPPPVSTRHSTNIGNGYQQNGVSSPPRFGGSQPPRGAGPINPPPIKSPGMGNGLAPAPPPLKGPRGAQAPPPPPPPASSGFPRAPRNGFTNGTNGAPPPPPPIRR